MFPAPRFPHDTPPMRSFLCFPRCIACTIINGRGNPGHRQHWGGFKITHYGRQEKLAWVSVQFDNGVHFSARSSVWIAYGRNRRDIVIVVLDSTGVGC